MNQPRIEDWVTSKDRYIPALRDPSNWYFCAQALREAADAVFATLPPRRVPAPDDPLYFEVPPHVADKGVWLSYTTRMSDVFLMLASFSLENLFKGELVRQNSGLILDDGTLHEDFTKNGHNLQSLCDRAQLTSRFTSEQRSIFQPLSAASISFGRYPGGPRHDKGDLGPKPYEPEQVRDRFHEVFDILGGIVLQDEVGDPPDMP